MTGRKPVALDKESRNAYEQHPFWTDLDAMVTALSEQKFDIPLSEATRTRLLDALTSTKRLSSKAPIAPQLYTTLLGNAQSQLANIQANESHLYHYSHYCDGLYEFLRQFPVQMRNIPPAIIEGFTTDVAARTDEFKALEQQIEQSQQTLEQLNKSIRDLADQHTALLTATKESKESLRAETVEQINMIKSDATDRLNTIKSDLSDQASTAKQTFAEKMKEIETAAAAELVAMEGLHDVGAQLLSAASGTLIATSWADRSHKELRTAARLRNFSYGIFALSICAAVFFVVQSLIHAEGLTTGDGILRASLTLALAGFGGIVLRESGQHKIEGDTAYDISLSLAALNTLYASADEATQEQARKDLGNTITIKNLISRYSNRDASKHSQNIDLKDVSSVLSETVKATK